MSYLSLHYHLIFATKHRQPTIAAEWRERLHEYLGGTILGLDGLPLGVGGVADHVHALVTLKSTHKLCDVLRELKKSASSWVHREIGLVDFAWQERYAAFTVSPPGRPGVQGYIARQEVHHRTTSSREELIELLRQAAVEYDEAYFE
jgi:REP element-mobilizing transposase RayT